MYTSSLTFRPLLRLADIWEAFTVTSTFYYIHGKVHKNGQLEY